MTKPKGVHVVKHSFNGKLVTYSLHIDNQPFLKPARPADFALGRREAYILADLFNGVIPWPTRTPKGTA